MRKDEPGEEIRPERTRRYLATAKRQFLAKIMSFAEVGDEDGFREMLAKLGVYDGPGYDEALQIFRSFVTKLEQTRRR